MTDLEMMEMIEALRKEARRRRDEAFKGHAHMNEAKAYLRLNAELRKVKNLMDNVFEVDDEHELEY